jgi:stress responsive alpha/beta barrel protein
MLPLMLRHVNLLAWKDGTEQAAIDALAEHLSGYAAEIPEIRDLSFGPDLRLAERNADFAIIVDFDDEEAFSRYLTHPAHDRMVGVFLKPILESRHAIQFHVSADMSQP